MALEISSGIRKVVEKTQLILHNNGVKTNIAKKVFFFSFRSLLTFRFLEFADLLIWVNYHEYNLINT